MRKRIASLLLCFVMLAGLLPTTVMAADTATALPTPAGLEWGGISWSFYLDEDPGFRMPDVISWNGENLISVIGNYAVDAECKVYRKADTTAGSDQLICSHTVVMWPKYRSTECTPIISELVFNEYDDSTSTVGRLKSGDYYFTVQYKISDMLRNSTDAFDNLLDSAVAKSELWHYTQPSQKIPAPTDLRYTDGVLSWTQPGGNTDQIAAYGIVVSDTDSSNLIRFIYDPTCSADTASQLENNGFTRFTFKVIAISRDICTVQSSSWSAASAVFHTDGSAVRSASLFGMISGEPHQTIDAGINLYLTGDPLDPSRINGYDAESGTLPAMTDLTRYLLLDTPAGGTFHLFNGAPLAKNDQMMPVLIRGAGCSPYHGQVNLTISGDLLASGEDLAVTPNEDARWDITASSTQTTRYDLWVYGEQVTSRNQGDILNNGMASFDPQTGTLFLNNADLQGEIKDPVIKSDLDALTLSVSGRNALRCMEGVAVDAKKLTIALTDAASSLTVCSDQKPAFAQKPILPNGVELWRGDTADTLVYTQAPSFASDKCVKIAAHEMQTTWTYDAANHWHTCTHGGCPHKTDTVQHTLQWVVGTPAVGTVPGWRHQKCSICAYTGEKVEIPCIKPIIETKSLPSAAKNKHYSAFVKVTGTAPFRWSLASGSLPKGLTLNGETGEISGMPTQTGTFKFTLKTSNGIGEDSAGYSITVDPSMNIHSLFTEKKTGCTNGSKDISLKNGETVVKKNQQYDFLYAAISHSMRNASQKEFDAVAGKLYNVLFRATYRPRCFGAKKDTIATWKYQNAGNCGTSITDDGLKQQVSFASSKGCASYAHFVSNYVYGKDGVSSYSKKVRIKSDPAEFKKYFEANVDPGETINYNYRSGKCHWIVFLGESEDEQGFYFISYEGGSAKKGGPYHNLNLSYWTYSAFASHVDNKSLSHWDTNKGSFSSGKHSALKIVSHCPVEMLVACGDAVLDSRNLNGSKTTALGTITATGEGANRSVTVDLNTDAGSFDLTLLGTDNGVMDLTVTHTYMDEDGNPQELTRRYSGVSVIKDGQITGLIPVDGDQTIQLDVPNPALEDGMEYWLANPGDTITGAEASYHPYNPTPEDNETPDGSSGSSGDSSASNPFNIQIADSKNGKVTVSAKTAPKGNTVKVTLRPNTGYQPDTISVADQAGNPLKLTDTGSGTFTFTMPASSVTIKATFKAAAIPVFTDITSGSYYEESVKWAVANGITTGTSATTFDPNGVCTRAQAVTFLWRAAGSPAPKRTTMPFTDVSAGRYYYDAVLWAVENGITKGTDSTTFSPNETCSRAQIVTFLWRSQKSPTAGRSNPFTDVAASAYYADAVLWAVKEKVTKGTSNTTFSPNDDCTRAQIVTFLWRTLA